MRNSALAMLVVLAAAMILGLWRPWEPSSEPTVPPTAPPAGQLAPPAEPGPPVASGPHGAVLVEPVPERPIDRRGVLTGSGSTVEHDPDPHAVPSGMARIVVKVRGAPISARETAGGLRRFSMVVRLDGSSERVLRKEFDLEGADATFHGDVPAGVPLQFALVAIGRGAHLSGPAITLGEGATEELLVDLGHGAVRTARVVDIPCDAVAGLRVESRGTWGSVRLPGGRNVPLDVRGVGLTDEAGEALVLVPDGEDVSYTIGLKERSFPAELIPLGEDVPPSLRPSVPLVTLRSAPGTKLLVGGGTVAAPSDWTRDHRDKEAHIVLLPSVLDGPQRVVLDGVSLGLIGPDAWPAGGAQCLDVGDLVWAEELASITFELRGFEGQKATLMVYRSSAQFEPSSGLDIPRSPMDVSFAHSRWRVPVGAIREPEHMGGGAKGLGKWKRDGEGRRTCTVFLEPGEYVATLQLIPNYRSVLRLEELVTGVRGTQTVILDEASVQEWIIVPRDTNGRRCRGLSMPGNLWLESVKLSPDRRIHGRWPYEGRPQDGLKDGLEHKVVGRAEPSFDVETFGTQPAAVRLSRTPGANGEVVALRPTTAADAAPGANLVAVVPTAQMLYLPLTDVTGGYLGGAVDGEVSVDDFESAFSSEIEVVPPTVSWDERSGIALALRAAQVTGVITESGGSQIHVRDWFVATAEGIELAGGGRGKFVTLTSKRAADLKLRLIPDVRDKVKFQSAYHGMSYANRQMQLWIPEFALRLEWWEGEVMVGATGDFTQDAIVIE